MNDVATITQGTDAWKQLRVGKVTASRMADMTAKTKTGWGAGRAQYMAQIVAEILTGQPQESGYMNDAMRWGTETEPQARSAYEWFANTTTEQVAFVVHPTIPRAGCSPDGLVGSDGLVEIKAPTPATHMDTLRGRSVPGRYVMQMQFQMAATGRQWCDFVSFDPRMPERMRLFVRRLPRDDVMISSLEAATLQFLQGVDDIIAELREAYP